MKLRTLKSRRGGGGIPCNGLYGESPPAGGTFFRLQLYERVGILLVEVYERVGKSVTWVCEGSKEPTDEFCGFIKPRKRSTFVIDSYLNYSAFTAVKRDAKF